MDIWTQPFDVDSLLELDPVGVKTVLVFGREDRELFQENIEAVADLAEKLRGTGVPLIVEPVGWGSRVPEPLETDLAYVADACRIAWEVGADILKAPYTGEPDSYADPWTPRRSPLPCWAGPHPGRRGRCSATSRKPSAAARAARSSAAPSGRPRTLRLSSRR